MGDIKILSDYTDYYDKCSNDNASMIYKRFMKDSMQRGKALNTLRKLNIKTIETKSVKDLFPFAEYLVVYTNPNGHNGTGKRVVRADEAIKEYANYLSSVYHDDCDLSVKYLHIGKKRIVLQYKKNEEFSLDKGDLIDVSMAADDFNYDIKIPIFSIDYIIVNDIMVATDFNEVENLKLLGIDKYCEEHEVIDLIKESILEYSKF